MTENEKNLVLVALRSQYANLFKFENFQQMFQMYAGMFSGEPFEEIKAMVCEDIHNKAKQLSEDIQKISLG